MKGGRASHITQQQPLMIVPNHALAHQVLFLRECGRGRAVARRRRRFTGVEGLVVEDLVPAQVWIVACHGCCGERTQTHGRTRTYPKTVSTLAGVATWLSTRAHTDSRPPARAFCNTDAYTRICHAVMIWQTVTHTCTRASARACCNTHTHTRTSQRQTWRKPTAEALAQKWHAQKRPSRPRASLSVCTSAARIPISSPFLLFLVGSLLLSLVLSLQSLCMNALVPQSRRNALRLAKEAVVVIQEPRRPRRAVDKGARRGLGVVVVGQIRAHGREESGNQRWLRRRMRCPHVLLTPVALFA